MYPANSGNSDMGPTRYPQPCALPTQASNLNSVESFDGAAASGQVSGTCPSQHPEHVYAPWKHPGAGLFVYVYPCIKFLRGSMSESPPVLDRGSDSRWLCAKRRCRDNVMAKC
jgi:hypothetical protein